MLTSTTALAIGTSAGTLTVTAVSALLMGALGAYTLLHHKQVFAWMKKIRRSDEANAELDKLDGWLADLYKAQCRRAKKPSLNEDFEDISEIGNMIKGVADHLDSLRNELVQVVERVEEYLDTALPELGTEVKQVPAQEHRALLVKAMRQEAARSELARSLITAQQKIRLLRRA